MEGTYSLLSAYRGGNLEHREKTSNWGNTHPLLGDMRGQVRVYKESKKKKQEKLTLYEAQRQKYIKTKKVGRAGNSLPVEYRECEKLRYETR
jgi:hypothetical protein